MIFVFSATGNSMHVARRIANATEDYIVDIADCLRSESFEFQTSANERVGFVFPTYFLGLPLPVEKFVEKLKLHCGQDAYVYLVTTFGTSPGASAALLPRLLKERTGITNPINTASVRMVDTWTPMFNVSDARRNHRIEQRAEVEIEEIASAIVTQSGLHMSGLRIPVWLARLYHSSYETERRVSVSTVKNVRDADDAHDSARREQYKWPTDILAGMRPNASCVYGACTNARRSPSI